MKKIISIVSLWICITCTIFSSDFDYFQEYWSGIGFDFGNSFEFSDTGKTHIVSPGLNFHAYGFLNNSNFGGVIRSSLLFPVIENGFENNYKFQGDLLLGLAGRLNISDSLKLYGGLGINIGVLYTSNYIRNTDTKENDSKYLPMLGIGSDLGLKYDITDIIYVNTGCSLSYSFIETFSDNTIMGIKPYIGVGINYYYKTSWGKLKN